MSQYQIISICQKTINIINCVQEGASLITKQGAAKKKHILVSTLTPQEQNCFLKTMFEFVLTEMT